MFRSIVVQKGMKNEHWSSLASPTQGRGRGFTYPRSQTRKRRRRLANAGLSTRVPLPARTERELRRRSDAGSSRASLRRQSDARPSTRDRLPVRTERELRRRSDAGRRTQGVVPARTERDSIDGLTRGNQLKLSLVISTRVASFP